MNIVVDKMHMAGHVDAWCKKTCDPSLYPELQKVRVYIPLRVYVVHVTFHVLFTFTHARLTLKFVSRCSRGSHDIVR